jgi:transcriptional regulator
MPVLFAPEPFPAQDASAIVRDHPFAVLVTASAEGIHATSTPLFYETDDSRDVLVGHLARRNAHSLALRDGQTALAVFSGPNAYVSPRWYAEKPEVPTWNYLAAHVRGSISVTDDTASLRKILARTAEVMERSSHQPWTLEQAPEGRVEALLPMIRGVRLRIESVEGVTRLSQKHPPADRMRVAWNLLASGDGDGAQIARMIAGLHTS